MTADKKTVSTVSIDKKFLSEQYNLKFYLDPAWASTTENYREHIRQHIILNHNLSTIEKENILDLQQLPLSKNYFFSITHSSQLGGYVVSPQPVGFDIENISRLTSETVKRVSSQSEWSMFESSDIRLLWPIKESLVKLFTIDKTNPPLMSDFTLTNFEQNKFETDCAVGYAWTEDDSFFALAFKK